jgi:hypothetical protein
METKYLLYRESIKTKEINISSVELILSKENYESLIKHLESYRLENELQFYYRYYLVKVGYKFNLKIT